MTKRGIAAIVVALVAITAFAGTAGAQTGRLSFPTAKKLATALAEKQIRNRDIVSYHLIDAKRLGPNTIAFAYDDRSADNVFCTAVVIVKQTFEAGKTLRSARFRGQQCDGIPADALAIESATRDTVRALRGTALATEDSLDRLSRSVRRCRSLEVPRTRRAAVRAILDVALVEALENPNDGALGDFVAALGQVTTSNAVLQRGIAGWADYLEVIRALPAIPDPCATLRAWAEADWSADESPIDLAAYRALDRRAGVDQRAIARAARYLAKVGVFPRTAVQFTPQGLLLRLAPELPATGGRGKVALHKPALL